jgi:hypothetical protein
MIARKEEYVHTTKPTTSWHGKNPIIYYVSNCFVVFVYCVYCFIKGVYFWRIIILLIDAKAEKSPLSPINFVGGMVAMDSLVRISINRTCVCVKSLLPRVWI